MVKDTLLRPIRGFSVAKCFGDKPRILFPVAVKKSHDLVKGPDSL